VRDDEAMARCRWLVVVLAACGGSGGGSADSGGGGGSDTGGGSTLAMQCADLCATYLTCMGSVNPMCEANCTSIYEHYRSEFFDAFVACYRNQCAKTQEMCATEAQPAIPRRPIDDTYQSACLAKRNSCAGVFPDDRCSSQYFTDAAVRAAMDCLARPCGEIDVCIKDAF
jgi:hypothetical protein